jgi:2-iminobutanoate/2-iminopropanoate deaminase
MNKEIVNASELARTYWPSSAHATRAGDFVFVTGQVANKPGTDPRDRKEVEMGTLEEQTVRVLENIKAILEAAGTSLANVVKRNVYLTHQGDFQPVFTILERYFPSPVASTGVITGLVPASARVEIDVIAFVPRQDAK